MSHTKIGAWRHALWEAGLGFRVFLGPFMLPDVSKMQPPLNTCSQRAWAASPAAANGQGPLCSPTSLPDIGNL